MYFPNRELLSFMAVLALPKASSRGLTYGRQCYSLLPISCSLDLACRI